MNILDKQDRSLGPIPNGTILVDKIVRYKWARPSSPGVFRNIDKHDLNIDDDYQRDKISVVKVKEIAANWDWWLFGTVQVAQREDESLWVWDGGHRLRASFYRSDISVLPCMVFQSGEVNDEARAFLGAAKMSTKISPTDAFKAAAVAQEPIALKTKQILADNGIVVSNNAYHGHELKCINTLQQAIAINESLATKCLVLCRQLAGERPINNGVFRGIFILTHHFKDRNILSEFHDEFERLTQPIIEKSIRQFKAEVGRGGGVIEGKAVMAILNKGKRTKRMEW